MWETLDSIIGCLYDINQYGQLNYWEIDFVDSMLNKTESGYKPTDKEMAKIQELLKREITNK
jgi:hypothetical protein